MADSPAGGRAPTPAQMVRADVPYACEASPSSGSDTDLPEFDDLRAPGASDDDADVALPVDEPLGTSFADLPHEILLYIFKSLMTQQDLQSCLLVCRRWCACAVQVLWYRPSFYRVSALFKLIHVMIQPGASFPYASYIRRLNFSMLAGELDDQLFGRMALCHRLERLTLSGCSQVTAPTLARVLSKTPQLIAVDLSGVACVSDETLRVLAATCARLQGANLSGCAQVTNDGVCALARQCHMLRRIKLGACELVGSEALTELLHRCALLLEADLMQCPTVDDKSVREVWLRPTQLRELKLAHCHGLTDLAFPSPSLRDALHPSAPPFQICENLRMLDLTGCTLVTDEAVRAIVAHAPRLRNVSLAKCARLTDESVYAMSELGRNLQHLHLAHVANVTDRAIIHLAHHCTRIRYLDLACCVQLTDESVVALAMQLPKLRRIGLVRVAQLTDRAIYTLVERYTNLERIHLSYCENIHVAAVFWLTLRLPRLTHLSLTGVPAFRCPELQAMCRPPPKEFNQHQRQSFCVYSGRGVHELRRFLQHVYADDGLAKTFGALPPEKLRLFHAGLAKHHLAHRDAPASQQPPHEPLPPAPLDAQRTDAGSWARAWTQEPLPTVPLFRSSSM